MATVKEKEVIKSRLFQLARAREALNNACAAARLMGMDRLEDHLTKATMDLAIAEGEIEQVVFGARHTAAAWKPEK